MRILVLTNPHSGPKGSNEELARDAFADQASVEVVVRAFSGDQIQKAADHALTEGFDCIAAAGGDGTMNAVASALVGSDVPMGLLPLGTLNHFAKDLRIPLELKDAAQLMCSGTARSVDVAEVNDRIFVNNSSIGLYPRIVKDRDGQMDRLGRGKWLAMLFAAISALRRFPTVHVRLTVDGKTWECNTPFVMVGNNRYEWDLLNFGSRATLNAGELGLYFTNRTGRFGLLRLLIRAWLHRLEQARDFQSMTTRELWIESRKHELRVSTDGEIRKLRTPLHYVIRPGALRVIAPDPAAMRTNDGV